MTTDDSRYPESFLTAVSLTLEAEGVFSDDPDDPGGATKFGITEGLAAEYGFEDVRQLTVEDATRIYYLHFWLPTRCDLLPVPVALELFDAAVNVGRRTGVKFLQRAFNVLRSADVAAISEDGVVGPETLDAVQAMSVRYVEQIVAAQNGEQYVYYKGLVANRPDPFRKFIRGWMRRLEWLHRTADAGQ